MTWISIEKTLPKCCEDILFTDGRNIYKGWLETYEPLEEPLFYNTDDRRNADRWPENITHWKELPKLPKVKDV